MIQSWRPAEVAVEQVFMHRNPDSALKLGQARAARCAPWCWRATPISEYAPRAPSSRPWWVAAPPISRRCKRMITLLLSLPEPPQADAADALAVAICHGHTRQTLRCFGSAAAVLAGRRDDRPPARLLIWSSRRA